MKKYIIECNGFQGSASYNRYDEARAAANFRTNCTGLHWHVRTIYTPKQRQWEELDNQTQIYLYWDYCAATPENEQVSFLEFDRMMQGFTFE